MGAGGGKQQCSGGAAAPAAAPALCIRRATACTLHYGLLPTALPPRRELIGLAWGRHANDGDYTTAALIWLERCGRGEASCLLWFICPAGRENCCTHLAGALRSRWAG